MDTNRRQFLKIILIGSGTLIAGKILGPLFSKSPTFLQPVSKLPAKKESPHFSVSEDEQYMSIYDSSGEEILQIDKSS